MATFLDELARLNSQNFLGGLATYGEAIKEQRQQQTLVQLYDKFKQDIKEPLPTGDQVDQFNKQIISETGGNLLGKEGLIARTPDIEAMYNVVRSMDRMGALSEIYQPYITAFATLGEDGVKIANSLSRELATKLELESRRGDLPFKDLQYQSMLLSHRFDKQKMTDYMTDRELNRQINEASDWVISESKQFPLIKGGKIISNDPKKLTEYNNAFNITLQELKSKFSNANDGVLTEAINLAMAKTGKSFTFNEDIYDLEKLRLAAMKGQFKGFAPFEVQTYVSFLSGWSDKWRRMDKGYKENLQGYMRGSYTPVDDNEKARLEDDRKIYEANGLYNQYMNTMALIDPTFMQTIKQKLGKKIGETDISGEVEVPMDNLILKQMGILSTKNIIRTLTSDGFSTGNYKYNPETFERESLLFEEKMGQLNQDLIPEGGDYRTFQRVQTEDLEPWMKIFEREEIQDTLWWLRR